MSGAQRLHDAVALEASAKARGIQIHQIQACCCLDAQANHYDSLLNPGLY